jgi:hypothetical protein
MVTTKKLKKENNAFSLFQHYKIISLVIDTALLKKHEKNIKNLKKIFVSFSLIHISGIILC